MKKNIKVSLILVILLVILYILVNYIENINLKQETIKVSNEFSYNNLILGGEACGIRLLATGVLVVGTELDNNIKIGDIILKVNGNDIESNKQLINYINKSNGEKITLTINRAGNIETIEVYPVLNELTGEYKLGLWVKDSSAGVRNYYFL